MLDKMGRHLNRPGHMHMMLEAPRHQKLVTHIFVKDSPYLDSDAVFGVRNSLVVEFPQHPPGKAPDSTKPLSIRAREPSVARRRARHSRARSPTA